LAYRADGTSLPNSKIKQEHERQANTFAANLLMPKALIESLQKRGIKGVANLARELQVSEEALRIRMGLKNTEFVRAAGEEEVEINPLRR
jgi:Zn-dependent peptidase ImmA (M78 family)